MRPGNCLQRSGPRHPDAGDHAGGARQLEEAREPLSHVLDFNLDPELKEYAGLLSDALDTQLAEAKKIELYELLKQGSALS